MNYRALSLPIRRSLEGVTWASLTVRWIPTEADKQARRREADRPIPLHERKEKRPPLYPLDGQLFPFERLFLRLERANKKRSSGMVREAANTNGYLLVEAVSATASPAAP